MMEAKIALALLLKNVSFDLETGYKCVSFGEGIDCSDVCNTPQANCDLSPHVETS